MIEINEFFEELFITAQFKPTFTSFIFLKSYEKQVNSVRLILTLVYTHQPNFFLSGI